MKLGVVLVQWDNMDYQVNFIHELIGASLSEPQTSESNGGIFIYIYIYIYTLSVVRRSINAS